jgi:diguanylate cyclase (GGDEF)-like protein
VAAILAARFERAAIMPKRKPGKGAKGRLAPKQAGARPRPATERRLRLVPDQPEPVHEPRRSAAMQLAQEVERLERELSAAHRQMAELAACADVDPLTEVLNRRGFERELARSLAYVKRHGTSAALLYIDLDDFKSVNDRHGHAGGDAVLKGVASVLKRHTRASDLVARVGGDEFVILLWNCDEANAQTKALILEAAIARTTAMHAGASLTAAASVGSALLLPLYRPAETIDRADRAMYARKRVRSGKPVQ